MHRHRHEAHTHTLHICTVKMSQLVTFAHFILSAVSDLEKEVSNGSCTINITIKYFFSFLFLFVVFRLKIAKAKN